MANGQGTGAPIIIGEPWLSDSKSILDLVGDHMVSLLTLYCQTVVLGSPSASGEAAHEIRQGLLQENPVPNRITILVNPNDPDDISSVPTWSDSPVGEGDSSGWKITAYEIGGGERWWRKFSIDIYVYLMRSQEDRSNARRIGENVIARANKAINENSGIGIVDAFGETAIMMLVSKVVPYEGGGPPRSFIWHGKLLVRVLTEKD